MVNTHFREQALHWANTFDVCCFFDTNGYEDKYGQFDWIVAAGAQHLLEVNDGPSFDALKEFYERHKNYLFGFMSYELKNELEPLKSKNPDYLHFPKLFFFLPQFLVGVKNNIPTVLIGDDKLLIEIGHVKPAHYTTHKPVALNQRISKEAYLEKISKLKAHIKRGDVYELNFCQEFYAENAEIDPLAIFSKLNSVSPTPLAGFFKVKDRYILSATPERFLSKRGNSLVSQPIKGTARRSADPEEDAAIKKMLKESRKEQAENVMIVDLVRHDLTKSAVKGTVATEELFGVYSFKQVHQLISTIRCQLAPEVHFIDAIKNAFPMGSMTGAPKISAMQLIDTYEASQRGLYSGTFGWISPAGDFDFNVVIRTILYNAANKYLSFQVGGAITYASDAEKEYEECLLKASAIFEVLKN